MNWCLHVLVFCKQFVFSIKKKTHFTNSHHTNDTLFEGHTHTPIHPYIHTSIHTHIFFLQLLPTLCGLAHTHTPDAQTHTHTHHILQTTAYLTSLTFFFSLSLTTNRSVPTLNPQRLRKKKSANNLTKTSCHCVFLPQNQKNMLMP